MLARKTGHKTRVATTVYGQVEHRRQRNNRTNQTTQPRELTPNHEGREENLRKQTRDTRAKSKGKGSPRPGTSPAEGTGRRSGG
jgi:hypothetical protein